MGYLTHNGGKVVVVLGRELDVALLEDGGEQLFCMSATASVGNKVAMLPWRPRRHPK
jgi:hypothetical protein